MAAAVPFPPDGRTLQDDIKYQPLPQDNQDLYPLEKPTPRKNPTKPRSFASEGVKDHDIAALPSRDWRILLALTAVAIAVRVFRIYQPTSVVFDEVHFGGFAVKYIRGRFFMDVHPPLAKMLIALTGWLAGFNGDFDFKEIGKDYIEPGVPYVAMRLFPAICGILMVPTMFLALKATGCRTTSALLGSLAVLFDNALTTQSRLILLDAPLVIFTGFTIVSWLSFTNVHELGPEKAFTPRWWFWLALTGLSLGATVSVKWVGLFTIAWVGLLTLVQLWVLLGDPVTVTPRLWFKHFFARLFCLVIIPFSFYLSMFAIHFAILSNSGDGDGFMSPEFQSTLNSKGMSDVPADVAFGSRITLRHWNTHGGYLHSHAHMYPTGSKQQQITLYPHKDENNIFLIENQTQPLDSTGAIIPSVTAWDGLDPSYVYNGAIIKLYHLATHRRVHSHDHRPPVTEADWQNEVSAYGYEGFEGDANDLFRVEIVPHLSDGQEARDRVRTIQSKFKLVHVMTGCTLFSHKVKLPSWGFEQQEVTCAKGGTLPNSVWYIESNTHPRFSPEVEKVNYRNPGLWGKFWELQAVMWRVNAGLTTPHNWESRPESWPLLLRGINFWGRQHRQVYLIGNPIVWWTSTFAVFTYLAFKGLAVLRWQRGYNDYKNVNIKRFDYEIGTSVLGWALHFFPFFLMERQLFLHHYLPALCFAIMALAQVFDFFAGRFDGFGLKSRPSVGRVLASIFVFVTVVVFALYAPLTYGNRWTKGECQRVKLFNTWDWDCNNFYNTYEQYDIELASASEASKSASASSASSSASPDLEVSSSILEAINDISSAKVDALAHKDDGKKESPVAPPHPDSDGPDPQTESSSAVDSPDSPDPTSEGDEQAEASKQREASPPSDALEATNE